MPEIMMLMRHGSSMDRPELRAYHSPNSSAAWAPCGEQDDIRWSSLKRGEEAV
jgi:hypothetical protein